MALMTEAEELLDVFFAYAVNGDRLITGNKAKEGLQIAPVGVDGIFCQPFLNSEVLKKEL